MGWGMANQFLKDVNVSISGSCPKKLPFQSKTSNFSHIGLKKHFTLSTQRFISFACERTTYSKCPEDEGIRCCTDNIFSPLQQGNHHPFVLSNWLHLHSGISTFNKPSNQKKFVTFCDSGCQMMMEPSLHPAQIDFCECITSKQLILPPFNCFIWEHFP